MRALAFMLALALGCGDDDAVPADGGVATPDASTRALVGSAEIVLRGDELEVVTGGRTTFALARGPEIRTFSERLVGEIGIWDIRRSDETRTSLALRESSLSDGVLSIVYGSEDDGVRGTLEVRSDAPDRTGFRFVLDAGEASGIALPVRCDEGGTFHGFGVQYNATNQRGEAFPLLVQEQGIGREDTFRALTGDEHTTYFPMPYYLDARGFGALWRTDYRVDVDLCASDESVAFVEVVSGEPVEWVVFHGPTPLDVVRQLGDVVGRPKPIPDWAFGLWVGSQGGRDEVLAEVDALEAAEVPVAAFWVQDWTGVRRNVGGGFGVQYRWEADDMLYPDLAGMIAGLQERGYRFLAYANPFVDVELPNHYPEMDERGLLMEAPEGGSYGFTAPNGMSSHPDLTNADARAYVQEALARMVRDYNIDGWMHDFGEWTPFDAVLADGSDPMAYHNRFVVDWQRTATEALDAERPDGDYCVFGRSGWTGVQEFAQIHWIGDQEATFSESDGLPTVPTALINMGLAGQYNATADIGGFSGGPSTKELWLRWLELGAFVPIMRTHEGDNRLDNWSWEKDAESTAAFGRFARIHDALAPLFRELADAAQTSSAPILRHPMLVFPEDSATWDLRDEFLIGDAMLVAPVLEEGATSRELYLPEGRWFHVWTGEEHVGPGTITVDAPIGSPPVFSREDRLDLRAIE